jgi:hypothetical protein
MTTTATTATIIQVHGTVFVMVVVVVVVEESPVVVFGAVADEPPAAGPVVVDVVLELPAAPAVCAKAIAGAVARNRAMSMRLSRRIEHMLVLPLNDAKIRLLARESVFSKQHPSSAVTQD